MNKEIPPFSIKPGEIHVWLFNLDPLNQSYPAWERLLAEDEIARSKRFKFALDRLRFIARRGILRQLVGQYTGGNPVEIIYRLNPYGKLSLIGQSISFNLSHSQDRIVFAFTLEKAVGVDIEQVHPLPDFSRMVEYWFSSEERARLSALPPALQLEAFFHVWTQKEAYIKARGEGLSLSLKDFSVSSDPNVPGKLLSTRGATDDAPLWKIINYIPDASWRVAVCVHSEADINAIWYAPDLSEFLSCGTSG